jgi:hypothetical protein
VLGADTLAINHPTPTNRKILIMSVVLNALIEVGSTAYRQFRYIFIDDDEDIAPASRSGYMSLGSGFQDFTHSRTVLRLIIFHGVCYFAFAILGFSFLVDNWSILDSMYFASVVFTTM